MSLVDMNLVELLKDLSFQGVQLWRDGEKLRIGGAQNVLTPDIVAQLKHHKTEILQLLSDSPEILNSYPLSYAQRGMWFLWQLAPESVAYNVGFSFRICSPVKVTTLRKSCQTLSERHPLFRTTFTQQDKQPVQKVHQSQLLSFEQIDASTWSEQELNQRVFQEYQTPFDIENGPLMFVRLFTCSEQEHILLLVMHHITGDAWSLAILVEELLLIYPALESGVDPSLTPLKHSYIDYVRWQKKLLTSEQGEKLWNYWQQKLAGELPVLNLPTDRPRPPVTTYNGASHYFQLSPTLTAQLKELAQRQGVTLYMLLLAAFETLLYRYTGQEDVLVGSATAGRTQAEFATLIGNFAESVVMRANFSGNPTFEEFLSQFRQTVSEALAHQDFPFTLLVERLQPERDPSRSPIFQALFIFQKMQQFENFKKLLFSQTDSPIKCGDLEIKPFELSIQEGRFDLTLEMIELNSSLMGIFKYNTDLFEGETIARMAGHFQTLLQAIVTNPGQQVAQLPLLNTAQQQQLLQLVQKYTDTAISAGNDKFIHPDYLDNSAVYILDSHQQLVPLGVEGEIYVDASHLSGDCSNGGTKTSLDLLDHPQLGCLWKSGQWGRQRGDGSLEWRGFINRLARIRGQRINLQEIEQALRSTPEVEACHVMVRQEQLVAYLVVSRALSSPSIHSHLQNQLPSYMLPSAYVQISTLPYTESGQVDETILNSLEVIDSDLIARWEEKLRSHPEIEEVAVVAQYNPAPVIPVSRGTIDTEEDLSTNNLPVTTTKHQPPGVEASSPSSSPCQVDEIAASTEFETWTDLLPGTERPAIFGTDSRKPLTHAALKEFVKSPPDNASLNYLGINITDRVCAAMPNGPEAAVAFLSLAQQCVFAPISPSLTEKQVLFELEDLSAVALVLQRGEATSSSNAKLKACAESLGVRVIELIPDASVCGVFALEEVSTNKEDQVRRTESEVRGENKPTRDNVALVLHTSGTTRKPKTVPLTHGNLTSGALTISRTIALTPEDTCINIMPLFHIHGLSVNVLASLLAGASVLCTPGLYATENGVADFFRWLKPETGANRPNVTWYSAVPTMHQAILEYAEKAIAETGTAPNHSLRLIRNCSAALLPAIAERMATAFKCEILPTYAMTESMPICSPDLGQGLAKRGSVGPAAGPQLIIGDVKENDEGKPILKVLPPYSEGEVMVRGACVTAGYELRDWMDYNPNEEAFIEGWLRTGDKGYIDEDGYVYLVGRFKEIINRAGEKISPMLVEDVLQRHPAVGQVVVFAAPHELLGEVVGAAIVPVANQSRPSLAALRQFAMKQKELELRWLPESLVWMSAIPKGLTGKPARIGLAKRLGLPVIPADATAAPRTFVATEGADGKFTLETIDSPGVQIANGKGGCQSLQQLAVYFTSKTKEFSVSQLQELEVRDRFGTLSQIMPSAFVQLEALPLTSDGQINRKRLREPDKSTTSQNETEQKIAGIWQEVLQIEEVGIYDNFFELGGKSILLIQVHSKLQEIVDINLKVVDLLAHPTVHSLSQFITGNGKSQASKKRQVKPLKKPQDDQDVAIIGMSGRFPGAKNLEEFWENLKNGVESISYLSDQQLGESGIGTDLLNNPNYVKVNGLISDIDLFDANFFNYSPREAKTIDPQQRLFLESAWEAIESSGYNPETYDGSIGIYAGGGMPTYLMSHLGDQSFIVLSNRSFEQMIGNDKDYLATRAAYKLNLTGPAINVQTACSTSLVAVHLACKSLLNGECNMALAGGVSIQIPQEVGYLYQEGMIVSPDGHCRAFDARARGTVFGSGVGVVLLKRLQDAIADGDCIHALIKGSAINNDGSFKLGYTAPSVEGQIGVISQAQAVAGIDPQTINYIEAHGTGTELGDPIEIEALTQSFSEHTQKKQFCAIGSVKTNVGHLNTAAGVAGLIKTVLALKHGLIPPSLNFEQPNPQIDFPNTPFYVNTSLSEWSSNGTPRRAGVSSFGIGGTNAHIVLEETPIHVKSQKSNVKSKGDIERSLHILTLSGKTEKALEDLVSRYHHHLDANPELDIANVCYTANTGRVQFNHRLAVVGSSQAALVEKLLQFQAENEVAGIFSGELPKELTSRKVAFLFTGQGSQYVNMARKLYEQALVFREALDQCHKILSNTETFQEISLLEILYPADKDHSSSSLLNQTAYTQPALFAIEYALFKLWQSWGIKPDVVMGHSVGEYLAATVAGVFSLEDGLKLIAARGRLMEELPAGGEMVSLMANESKVQETLNGMSLAEKVTIAAINGPESIVISGESVAVRTLVSHLESVGIKTKQLQVSHAFHSPLMEPMLAEFEAVAHQITYHQPTIPLVSNVTGIRADDTITTAKYWVNHVLEPVRFAESMETLHQLGYEIFLEIGPKPILLGMGRQCLPEEFGLWLPSLREGVSEWQLMLSSLAQLYVQGAKVDWSGFDREYARQKVVLPTYPFQRERYWIESNKSKRKKPYLSTEKLLHPLLGKRFYCAGQPQQLQFESLLAEDEPAYLKHHRVFDRALFPTTAYLEIALAAGVNRFQTDNLVVEDLVIQTGLILPEGEIKTVQTILTPSENQTYQWQVFTQQQQPNQDQPQWRLHANGKIRAAEIDNGVATVDLEKYLTECSQAIEIPDHYQHYRQIGIEYGSSFQGIQQLWKGSNQAIGKIELSPDLLPEATDYHFHPALLDGALQVLIHALPQTNTNQTYLPVGIEQLKVYSRPGLELWAMASVTIESQNNWTATLTLVNGTGEILATLFGLRVKLATPESLLGIEAQSISNYLYEVQWRPQARFGRLLPPTYLPSLLEISQKLNPTLSQLSSQTDLDNYGQLIAELEDLSVEFVLQAFREMGWSYPVGEKFTVIEAIQHLRIVPSHHRLFNRLLEMLLEVGILKKNQDKWQVQQELGETNLKEKTLTLLSQYPQAQAELTLLNRCASQLSAVLRGAIDPVQLVFPEGDLTTATQLYQDSPAAKVMNSLVEKAITTALEKLPPQRGVRLLELGAGTGGTTSYILPDLPPDQSEYVFTDIGALFTAKAQEKFRDYPFVTYQTLDIEQDPTTQGFIAHQYDIIIAANVLHATTSLEQTLSHVRQLLTPGGILVLLEGTTRQGWLDLIFGLLEGWWKFQDLELRRDYPLLSRSKWKQLLRETGFTEVVTLPETDGVPTVLSQQAVIIAQLEETTIEKTSSEPKGWLILADQQGIAQKVATQLRSSGQVCTLVFAGEKYQQIAAEEITINPHNPEEFKQLVAHLKAQLPSLYGVVQCWTTEAGIGKNISSQELENLSQLGCGTTLSLVQALVKAEFSSPPRLWLVTQGAQPVPETAAIIPGVVQSSVWGLAKVISLEHPELNCVRIDLDPQETLEHQAWELFSEIWSEDHEDQVALRGKTRYVPRLVSNRQAQPEVSLSFRDDGSYLITGGLGGIGLLVARWMVERGAKHLVLLGRSSPDETARKKLTELEQTGAFVVVEKADVSDVESMTRVMSNIEQSNLPLAGVIHSAGMLSDGVLQNQNWSSFEKVMAPKVQGAWLLHQLTKNQPMDFFVLFSSAASLFGSPGQGNHAAANAFLDGLAHYRRGMGLSGLSIHWGAVSQVGAAAEGSADLAELKGMGVISPIQVLDSLELLMSSSNVEVGVVPIKWSAWQDRVAQWLFLSDWHQTTHAYDHTSESFKCSLLQQFKTAVPSERREILVAHVRRQVAEVLGLNSSQQVDLKQGFFDLGMDSLMAVDFRNRLQKSLECDLPSTLTFKYPDLAALIDYLTTEVFANYFSVTLEEKEKKVQEENSPSSRFQEMSEDEIAKLLAQKIEALE